jgi:hypothetical protein
MVHPRYGRTASRSYLHSLLEGVISLFSRVFSTLNNVLVLPLGNHRDDEVLPFHFRTAIGA